jgi:hypothetical protein
LPSYHKTADFATFFQNKEGKKGLPESKILPGNGRIFKNYKLQATNYKQKPNYNVQNYKQPYRA